MDLAPGLPNGDQVHRLEKGEREPAEKQTPDNFCNREGASAPAARGERPSRALLARLVYLD
jgi:hypothetical protein